MRVQAGFMVAILAVAPMASFAGAQTKPADWRTVLAGDTAGFSGVALIGRDDTIEIEMANGVADARTRRPNSPATRFSLGSINKTFTAIAIAQLIQQGRVSLDDNLTKHIPDYPNRAAGTQITVRDLLAHRSGVAQFMRAEFGDITVSAMVTRVASEPQAFEPGTSQQYSNGGYVVLGRIVEIASGKPYWTYLNDHIFRPAGMTASGVFRPGDDVATFALGSAGTEPLRTGNPAGSSYSTAADLFRFARALRTGRLLNQEMTRYVLNGTFAEQPRWGFSLREQAAGNQSFIGNGGGAPGINAEFRFERTGPHTVVVLSNSSPPAATNLLTAILNRIAGQGPFGSDRDDALASGCPVGPGLTPIGKCGRVD